MLTPRAIAATIANPTTVNQIVNTFETFTQTRYRGRARVTVQNSTGLYHVTSVFDFLHGTLVNTGDQVYSGTIAGSAPVMIHDDQFRFEANLNTGQESGQVFLFDRLAGPKVRCTRPSPIAGSACSAASNLTRSVRDI